MRYRVRVDLSFDNLNDARLLMDQARDIAAGAVSINEGQVTEEVAFCELEICRHEEGLPCTRMERLEVRRRKEPRL